jgi:hypothetical protein
MDSLEKGLIAAVARERRSRAEARGELGHCADSTCRLYRLRDRQLALPPSEALGRAPRCRDSAKHRKELTRAEP